MSIPQSYTTCALGIRFVGYVMICFSATSALCSQLYGKVAQYTGRIALYAFGRGTLPTPAGRALRARALWAALWGCSEQGTPRAAPRWVL